MKSGVDNDDSWQESLARIIDFSDLVFIGDLEFTVH